MNIDVYHIDAFTDKVFSGNPAAVCVLKDWLSDELLNKIAQENNQPVTAFLVKKNDVYNIRWITPEYELDLCGHGSLAAGYVIYNVLEPNLDKVDLQSRTEVLPITRSKSGVVLNFPSKAIEAYSSPSLEEGLGLKPKATYQHKHERCLAIYDTEDEIKHLVPDMQALKKLPHRGITVTAPGREVDFVSRTFYPQKMISEDPATGASHCLLAPYWANQLNKDDLHAKQVSKRGGEMFCQCCGDRVFIEGRAVLYMKGIISIS